VHKDEYTLEELAAETGMTARNVRAYQTKGLIPAPARSGRRSVYGLGHLLRLQAIERARRRGASLSLIAAHLAAGQPLDDDTLVGWQSGDPLSDRSPPTEHPDGRGPTHDIAPLLAQVDPASQPAAHADIAELMAAGVLTSDGDRVYAGRDLATCLHDLHRNGFPVQLAVRTARLALLLAVPLTAGLRDVAEAAEQPSWVLAQLTELATAVVHHLWHHPVPEGQVHLPGAAPDIDPTRPAPH
jgi:DNA-binding transcriptional MerR regulator